MHKPTPYIGTFIALIILLCWALSTTLLMQWQINYANPVVYFFMLLQMHLYTGLFITAHDAMHGTVSPNKTLNNSIGYTATLFYAAFWYPKLYTKHHQHHQQGGFISWYIRFIRNYLSIWQVVFMAVLFNVLKLWIPQANLLLFWVAPSLLSTLQLFYFGTYLPHRGEHSNKHQSRSQAKNHVMAFLSCYFFGYHYEHHDSPGTPWWLLWRMK
jgi:beta-carotene ketolase (CrtW type)